MIENELKSDGGEELVKIALFSSPLLSVAYRAIALF